MNWHFCSLSFWREMKVLKHLEERKEGRVTYTHTTFSDHSRRWQAEGCGAGTQEKVHHCREALALWKIRLPAAGTPLV